MIKTLDTEYLYRNGNNHKSAWCRIRVFEEMDEQGCPVGEEGRLVKTVVIATMRMDRPSEGSIENDAEELATEIRDLQRTRLRHRFRRWRPSVEVGEFVWIQQVIEHAVRCLPDSFDTVAFEEENGASCRPAWHRTDRQSVETLIGHVLD